MSWVNFWCCRGGDRESERPEEQREKEGAQIEKKEIRKRRRSERKWSSWRKVSHDAEEMGGTPLEEKETVLMEETKTVDINTETEQLLSVNTKTATELLESAPDDAGPPSSTPLAGEQRAPGTSELLEILPRDVAGGAEVDQRLENQTTTCEQTEEETRRQMLLEETPTSSTSLESESGAPVVEMVEDTGVGTPKTPVSSHVDPTVQSFDDEKMMTVVRVISAAESFRYLQENLEVSDLQNLELPPVNNTIAVIEAACEVLLVLLQRLASSPDQYLINKVLSVMRTVPAYTEVGLLLEKHLNSIRGHYGTALEPGTELQLEVGVDAEAETLQKIFCPHLDETYTHLVDEMLTGLLVQLAANALIYLQKVNSEPPVSNNNSKAAIITQALDTLLEELVTGRDQHLIEDFLYLMSSAPNYQDVVEVLASLLDTARKYYCGCLAGDQTEKLEGASAPAKYTKDRLKRMAPKIEPPQPPQLPQPPQPSRVHRNSKNRDCAGVKPPPTRTESQHGHRQQSRVEWTPRHQGPRNRPEVPRHQLKEEATDQGWHKTNRPGQKTQTPNPRGTRHHPNDQSAPPQGEGDNSGGRGRRRGGRRRRKPDWWQHDDR